MKNGDGAVIARRRLDDALQRVETLLAHAKRMSSGNESVETLHAIVRAAGEALCHASKLEAYEFILDGTYKAPERDREAA